MLKALQSEKYNNIRVYVKTAYLILYAVLMLLNFIPVLKGIPHATISFLLPIGGLILALDVIGKKIEWKNLPLIMLVAFSVSYCITIAVNGRDIVGNIKSLCWLLVQMFVIGSIFCETSWDKLKKVLKIFCKCYICMLFICCAVSIWFYIADKEFFVPNTYGADTSVMLKQGWHYNRLFGIFQEPNFAAWFSLASIIMTWWLLREGEKKGWRIFLITNLVIEIIYFLCSNSRGGLVALFVMFMVWGLCFVLRKENRKDKKRIIRSIAIALVVIILIIPVRFVAQKVLSYTRYGCVCAYCFVTGQDIPPFSDSSRKEYSGTDVSTNRIPAWTAALETLVKNNPVFGLGDRNIAAYVRETVKDRQTIAHDGTVTSTVVKLPVASGIIGLLIMGAYGVLYVVRVIKLLKKTELPDERRRLLEASFILAITCIASAAFLEDLLFCNTLSCVLFWGAVALGNYIIAQEKKEEASA